MASGKNNYLCNKFLNQIFNGAAYTLPATLYCALFTAAPSDATGSGTEVSTTSTGYARVAVTPNTTNFSTSAATSGSASITNNTAITFPAATASWGSSIVAFGIYDAATGGNLLYWGALTTAVSVASGNVFQIPASSLTVSEA